MKMNENTIHLFENMNRYTDRYTYPLYIHIHVQIDSSSSFSQSWLNIPVGMLSQIRGYKHRYTLHQGQMFLDILIQTIKSTYSSSSMNALHVLFITVFFKRLLLFLSQIVFSHQSP